jgi:hypothetical protein
LKTGPNTLVTFPAVSLSGDHKWPIVIAPTLAPCEWAGAIPALAAMAKPAARERKIEPAILKGLRLNGMEIPFWILVCIRS